MASLALVSHCGGCTAVSDRGSKQQFILIDTSVGLKDIVSVLAGVVAFLGVAFSCLTSEVASLEVLRFAEGIELESWCTRTCQKRGNMRHVTVHPETSSRSLTDDSKSK
jgi:hypothetical protein